MRRTRWVFAVLAAAGVATGCAESEAPEDQGQPVSTPSEACDGDLEVRVGDATWCVFTAASSGEVACAAPLAHRLEADQAVACSDQAALGAAFFGAMRDQGWSCWSADLCRPGTPELTVQSPAPGTAVDLWGATTADARPVTVRFWVGGLDLDACTDPAVCPHVRARIDGDACNVVGTGWNARGTASPLSLDFSWCGTTGGEQTVELSLWLDEDTPLRDPATGAIVSATTTVVGEAAPVPCEAGLDVTPATLDFGWVRVGEAATRSFTVTNPSVDAACPVSLETVACDGCFTTDVTGALDLAPGEAQPVTVTYAPAHAGACEAEVRIAAAAPEATTTIGLTGESTMAHVAAPAGVTFETLPVGCLAERTAELCLENRDGADPVTVVAAWPTAPAFSVVDALPLEVPAGGRTCLTLRFATGEVGLHEAALFLHLDTGDLVPVPLSGPAEAPGTWTETFVQTDRRKVDVLWVVDNSGSMGQEQALIASETPLAAAALAGVEWQMGLVSTDVSDGTAPFVAPPGDPGFVRWDDPNPADRFAARMMSLGTMGSAFEKAFLAGQLAFDTAPAGFLRPDARKVVIYVTDEPEQSPGTVDSYLAHLSGLDALGGAHAFGVAGDAPDGCTGVGGTASAAPRIVDIAARSGGVFHSICAESFAPLYDALADRLTYRMSFPLEGTPASITQVTVTPTEGAPMFPGYMWDGATGTVVLTDTEPLPGDAIEVVYACRPIE